MKKEYKDYKVKNDIGAITTTENEVLLGYNMWKLLLLIGGRGIKIWGESTGGFFSGGGMSKFLASRGTSPHPPSK